MTIPIQQLTFAVALTVCSNAAAQVPPVPPVPFPPQNQLTESKRVLGKMLFWDEQLSSDNTMACGTCHITERGGADPRLGAHPGVDRLFNTADDIVGSPGVINADRNDEYERDPSFGLRPQVTGRNAQNFIGGLWSPTQFWDGRASSRFEDPETGAVVLFGGGSLESQVSGPPVSDVEMAHADRDWSEITAKLATVTPLRLATDLPADVAAALNGNVDYPTLFQNAFGTSTITATRIALAIATYERTLVANQTPWDAFNAGNPNALTRAQRRGLNFFAGSVCAQCHRAPLFTDNQFHNIGLRPPQEDLGRQIVTGQAGDRGRFKTPSLRNVGLRENLMHVGWITDVRDALDFYRSARQNTGHVQFRDNQDPRVRGIAIPGNVLPDLVDFLSNGLTDPRVANATFPFDRPTLLSERQAARPQIFGQGAPGTGGLVPQMIAASPMAIDNPDFRAGLSARPGALAALLLSSSRAAPGTGIGGLPIYVGLGPAFLTTVNRTLDATGVTTWSAAIGDEPSFIGLTIVGQWFVNDPAGPLGLAASPGAEWTIL